MMLGVLQLLSGAVAVSLARPDSSRGLDIHVTNVDGLCSPTMRYTRIYVQTDFWRGGTNVGLIIYWTVTYNAKRIKITLYAVASCQYCHFRHSKVFCLGQPHSVVFHMPLHVHHRVHILMTYIVSISKQIVANQCLAHGSILALARANSASVV